MHPLISPGKRLGARLLALSLLLLLPLTLRAQDQTTSSGLRGTVTDSTGATIAGATVTVTGADNGIKRSATTEANGSYSVRLLPPAAYDLSVRFKGFKTYTQQGITLLPGQTAQQPIQLTIGTEDEQVTVTSQAPLLNTNDPNLSAEITAKQVVDLPLNLRNVYGLATLNSSVQNSSEGQKVSGGGTGDTADQDISFLNFGGGFFGTTAFLLDGIWDTASDWGAVVYVPSVDAVAEFKIQTNSFTAQYGFSTGNVINVTTKAGTNAFHGDVFEFLRNSKLDANPYFNAGNPKPSFRRNQFGASIGGPLIIPGLYKQRDKTFFFGLYEGLRQSTPFPIVDTVPTTAFQSGDFSALLGSQVGTDALGRPILKGQLYNPFTSRAITQGAVDPTTGLVAQTSGFIRDPFVNNQIQAAINPVGAAIAKSFPAPTNSQLANNFARTTSIPVSSNEYTIRVDHNINDLSRIFGRWSQKFEQKGNYPAIFGANNPGGPGNIRPNNRYSVVAGYSRVLNATTAVSADIGLERWAEKSETQSYPFDSTSIGLPGYLTANSPVFPLTNIEGQATLGPSQGNEGTGLRNVGSFSVDLTKTAGNHNLSFGFFGAAMQNNGNGYSTNSFNFDHGFTAGPNASSTTDGTGYGFASLLIGTPSGGNTTNSFNAAIEKKYQGFYVQDDWKATPRLTVNLGLRYEWQSPPTERHNRQAYFDPHAPNPIGAALGKTLPGAVVYTSSSHRGLYNTSYNNVAPRIGFSDQATSRLVLRGGYGIFFSPQYFGGGSTPGFSQTTNVTASVDGGITPASTLSNPFPAGLIQPHGNSLGGLQDVGQSTSNAYINRRSPYIQQYSLGFQYGFTDNDVLDVTYIGNHGTKLLLANFNASQLNPTYLSRGTALNNPVPNPFYGTIAASSCGLNNPTIPQGLALQPFPQYCSVNQAQAPVGFSSYNALQANYNHRFHQGLNLLVSYTYSKFLDNVEGTNNWSIVGDNGSGGIRNFYNLAAEKSVDGSDTPHSLVVNYIYELPVGRGRHFGGNISPGVDAVVGGWQVSGITSLKSGIPLGISGGGNSNLYGGNQRPDQIADPHLAHPTIHQWFNTAAFAPAAPYTFGNTARFLSYLRSPRYDNWDFAAEKFWSLPERFRLQGRAEFYNLPNHANFYAPDTGITDGGFGTINAAFPNRSIQFALKLLY